MTGKDIAKITVTLGVFYVLICLLIALVFVKSSPIIFKIQKEEKERARQKMMPLHLIVNAPEEAHAKINELLPEAAITNGGSLDAEVDLYEKGLKKLKKKIKKAGATYVERRETGSPTTSTPSTSTS
jgi:Na+-translocating ferredoxin:NAD+ oxidoreductase RnfG subunit